MIETTFISSARDMIFTLYFTCFTYVTNFPNSHTLISEMPVSGKTNAFTFWTIFDASQKFSEHFVAFESFILDTSPGFLSEYIFVLYGYKLFIISFLEQVTSKSGS